MKTSLVKQKTQVTVRIEFIRIQENKLFEITHITKLEDSNWKLMNNYAYLLFLKKIYFNKIQNKD